MYDQQPEGNEQEELSENDDTELVDPHSPDYSSSNSSQSDN